MAAEQNWVRARMAKVEGFQGISNADKRDLQLRLSELYKNTEIKKYKQHEFIENLSVNFITPIVTGVLQSGGLPWPIAFGASNFILKALVAEVIARWYETDPYQYPGDFFRFTEACLEDAPTRVEYQRILDDALIQLRGDELGYQKKQTRNYQAGGAAIIAGTFFENVLGAGYKTASYVGLGMFNLFQDKYGQKIHDDNEQKRESVHNLARNPRLH